LTASFAGIRFAENDGPLLYAYAKDESAAAEIEDDFSLVIADVASWLLKHEIKPVVVLPKSFSQRIRRKVQRLG
jgi:hypothetical protein